MLIDTGLGIEAIRPVAERLTPQPLSVVNTHAHFDHVGGNHEFDDIAIHELGTGPLGEAVPKSLLKAYLAFTGQLLEAAQSHRELDRRFFHILDADADPRALPPSFDPESWTIGPCQATRTLREGDRVDLGHRTLTVLHTPGHAPEAICLLDEHAGLLFAGDTISTGPMYAQFPDSDLEAYADSVARLAALKDDARLVFVHHYGRALVEPHFLADVAEAFSRLLGGSVEAHPARDVLGTPVREVSFDRFSIFVSDDQCL